MEALFLDAGNEFTRRMNDLYDHVKPGKMSPVNSGSGHNYETAFYAIAATMHMNHNHQDEVAAQLRIEPTSFYDLVKGALRKSQDSGVKASQEVLLSGINREIMIELIKARVDILSAIALKHMTDKREMNLGQKLKGLAFIVSAGHLGRIALPATINDSNPSTLSFVQKALEGAVKARNFLKEIGVEKNLEKTLRSAYGGVQGELNQERRDESEIRNLVKKLLE